MQNLLRFIVRYSFQIIFVILEVFALTLVFQTNPLPHARLFQFAGGLNGFIYNQASQISRFFHLTEENATLVTENARLRYELSSRPPAVSSPDSMIIMRNPAIRYDFVPARVINNMVNRQNNYITINVGTNQGIRPDMGVLGPEGIVGVVRNVSANFSTVLPVLNSKFRASVKIRKSEFFGTLTWDGISYREALLSEIPGHENVYIGDTVVTTGFSAIFPEGEMVGIVNKIDRTPAGSFYLLRVMLNQDFKKLTMVYVIRYYGKQEQERLELQTYD